MMSLPPIAQRMYHGHLTASQVAEQLAVRFRDRFHHVALQAGNNSAYLTIGSRYGTPLAIHLADTQGGILVTMGKGPSDLSNAGDAAELLERAARSPLSMLSMLPDALAEAKKKNIIPQVWSALDEIFHLAGSLAGEIRAPQNPRICPYCQTGNPAEYDHCQACGGALPVNLPRICPKCSRGHTSDALFCQACGTRLVSEE